MATLSKTYASEDAARRAVGALRAAGVPLRDIRLLTSRPPQDIRREPAGGFAGPIGTDAPIGSYASVPRRRGEDVGSFATGGFADAPGSRREGSFADAERVVIVSHRDDREHARVTGFRGVRQLLNRGHAVVLVDVAEITPSEVRAQLEQVAQAA